MRVRKPWVRARLTLEGWYVRFMKNPTGPTGRVTGLSAVKLYLSIRMNLMVVKHIRSRLANELMSESQRKACACKPQAAMNRKTRDYHRFPHDDKPGRRRMNTAAFESWAKDPRFCRNRRLVSLECLQAYLCNLQKVITAFSGRSNLAGC